MTDTPLNTSASGTIAANGSATVNIGPQLPREQWDVATTTVTALGMTVTVSQFGNIVDSTMQDPRPTATDNTPFQLKGANQLVVKWSNGTPGQAVTVTVTGTRRFGGG